MTPSRDGINSAQLWALLDEVHGLRAPSLKSMSLGVCGADHSPTIGGQEAQHILDVFWTSRYPVALQDAQFRFVNANAGYLALTAHSLEQLIGRTPNELGCESVLLCSATEPVASLGSCHGPQEGRMITATGDQKQVRLARRVLNDPSGQIYYLTVVHEAQEMQPHTALHRGLLEELTAQQKELEVLARDRELMFSVAGVGLAFIQDSRIQRANTALGQLLGYSTEELIQLPERRLFFEESEFEFHSKKEMADLQRQGRSLVELPLRRRDERTVWVQVSKRLVVEGDVSGGAIASYVNVDDRHRAERSIALQADRTRTILDSVLVGIVTVGPQGIQWMNRSAQRMFGGHLTEFINEPISTVASAESDHPFLQTQYLNELLEGRTETFECRVKARDGREFWVVGNVVATGREHAERQLTYALLDVDRRRQAEARIQQTQASLQRIIEAAPMAITLRDAKSLRVLQINETAANIVGRAAKDLIGMSPEEMHDPETAKAMKTDMEAALQASEVTKREYTIVTQGQARIWDARFMPLSTRSPAAPHGLCAGPDQLLLVATDVTEQRLAQQAKFDAAIAQREMFVKEVHHRIKNNLQGVAGLLQQIAQRKPEVAQAMTEVITQVQAIAHVYGLQVGRDGPLRLASVFQAIALSVQRTFGRTITLTLDARSAGPDPEVWVLPETESIPVALALNELLTNAVKHSRDSQAETPSAVVCQFESLPGSVVLTIANTGQLQPDFNLEKVPGGVSGLGLVRSLLPRRSATLSLAQESNYVVAKVQLIPPGVQNSSLAPPTPTA